MPTKGPDAGDPLSLTGVQTPAELADVEAMALGLAEEFAANGWDEPRLLSMFRSPFYSGPHLAFTQLGETRVCELIADAVRPWKDLHA